MGHMLQRPDSGPSPNVPFPRSPGVHGARGVLGKERIEAWMCGPRCLPPARSPLPCELEAGVGREEEQVFVGGWGTLGWGPVLPRSSFSGKETEESENSNFELGLPGHYKGIFVKLRGCRCFHWELGL